MNFIFNYRLQGIRRDTALERRKRARRTVFIIGAFVVTALTASLLVMLLLPGSSELPTERSKAVYTPDFRVTDDSPVVNETEIPSSRMGNSLFERLSSCALFHDYKHNYYNFRFNG